MKKRELNMRGLQMQKLMKPIASLWSKLPELSITLAWWMYWSVILGIVTLPLLACSTQSITPDLGRPTPELMTPRPTGETYLARVEQEQKAYQSDLGNWEVRLRSLLTKLMD